MTGHSLYRCGGKHWDELNLINMNGRLYDPIMGRMLSPDPDVTYPEVPLSYNRYAYAMNNPVNFVDPNGENPLLIGALIGMAINTLTHIDDINTFGDFVKAAGIGAVSGFMGGITGLAVPVGIIPGVIAGGIGGASTGAFSGLLNAAVFGGDLSQAMASGAIAGGVTGGLMGGFGGYMKAKQMGRDIWSGKLPDQTKPPTSEAVANSVGTGTPYPGSEPISKLPSTNNTYGVPNDWASGGVEWVFVEKRFTAWGTLGEGSNIAGAIHSCVYEAASYAASQHNRNYPASDYRSAYATNPKADLPVDDVNDFLHRYFDGNEMTNPELGDISDINVLKGNYKESMMAKMRLTHTESHMVNVVGHRGGAIVFYDPGANGYRYMPYRDFYENIIQIYNNVTNPIAP